MKNTIAALLICLMSFAAYSNQYTEAEAIVDEFSVLFKDVPNVGIAVRAGSKFGAQLHGVNQTPDEMCVMLKKVAPSLQYVIINHNTTGSILQVYKECN